MMSSKGHYFPQTPQIHLSRQIGIIIFMHSFCMSAAVQPSTPTCKELQPYWIVPQRTTYVHAMCYVLLCLKAESKGVENRMVGVCVALLTVMQQTGDPCSRDVTCCLTMTTIFSQL